MDRHLQAFYLNQQIQDSNSILQLVNQIGDLKRENERLKKEKRDFRLALKATIHCVPTNIRAYTSKNVSTYEVKEILLDI
uniref:Uncharacterized protein n=1 Tax=Bacillus phage Lima TaxID=1260284 RepID=K7WTR6_9VIRU|nr:hypothetical protein [Bacillus phage Lima]